MTSQSLCNSAATQNFQISSKASAKRDKSVLVDVRIRPIFETCRIEITDLRRHFLRPSMKTFANLNLPFIQ